MFNPVSLFIGLRYTRSKRRNNFISFISFTSIFGIAMGIAVLITVMSVMNGFHMQIRKQIFSMAQQVTISSLGGSIPHWQELIKELPKQPHIIAASPLAGKEGLLSAQGQVQAAYVFGVLPESYQNVSQVGQKMVGGSWDSLKPNQYHLVIGQTLADTLDVKLGDKITVVTPEASFTPVGILPRFKTFTVSGVFAAGKGTDFDKALVFIHLNDAQKLFRLNDAVSAIQLKVSDLYLAPQIASQLSEQLPPFYAVRDWTQDYGALFEAIKLEKTMMFIILSLIIAVAAFNLVSSLVMVVTDKQADIAILRTLGATKRNIMTIFIVQGFVVGFLGIAVGIVGGMLLALNVTSIVNTLETILQVKFISSNFYYVDYIPSDLQPSDIWTVSVASLIMCLLATLYPAWRAASVEPAEALRYE